MKQIIKKLCLYWQARKKEKKAIKTITQLKDIEIVYKKETSITLGCLTTGTSNNKPSLSWNGVELLVKEKTGDVRDFFRKVYKESNADDVSPQKYLDELIEVVKLKRIPREVNKKLLKYADDVLKGIVKSRDKKGAVCVVLYDGISFFGKSFKKIPKGELPNLHPILDAYIRPVYKKMINGEIPYFGQHGRCAEVDAINQLLYYLEKKHGKLNLEKAKSLIDKKTISKAVEISKKDNIQGSFKEACKSCNPMLSYFKILEDLTGLKKI